VEFFNYNLFMRKIFYLFLLYISFTVSLWSQQKDSTISVRTDSSLIIGEYTISKVIDGDTFRFEGLDKSTRLLGIDTEETFKDSQAQQKSFELSRNWLEEYNKVQSDEKTSFPIKINSPFGYETWMWTKDFVKDVLSVRLEKDDSLRVLDTYGRYLSYVILKFNDKELNYNVECVRQGYSPYYNKYGNSKRFHKEFLEAQNFARENKLGIWNSDNFSYPDYEQRIQWWNKRAMQIEEFEKQYSKSENSFNLMNDGEYDRMTKYLGREVLVFANITEIISDKNPVIIRVSVRKGVDFDLVIFEQNKSLLEKYDLTLLKEYYIFTTGILTAYRDKYEIIIEKSNQIWTGIDIK